ncbi:MAG: PD-(D/E)XK nuclease family protein [Bryobacterales bacterium]|nr:PD-(D/E)XK nuclease family protein [Bryobacterales bacterium]
MEDDLRNLIDAPRFRAYHRKFGGPRKFNTFDVLQYANYEIRHSNVLAWLLRPADTHGIGSRFLRWFVNHVNGQFPAADTKPLPETSFEAGNVEVWRERDHVDITIRFKTEKCLIAVENKTESASPHHLDQVRRYEETLLGKHEGHTVRSVLLTTSLEGSDNFPSIAHVGWDSVLQAIRTVSAAGEFTCPSVQTFIRQYLDMIERWFRPGGEGYRVLLDDHRAILKRLRRVLGKHGDDGVRGMVSADRAEYRNSLVNLVKESRHNPMELRAAVANYLRGRGVTPTSSNNRSGTYWLGWTDVTLGDAVLRMGGHRDALSWFITFTRHDVKIDFAFRSDNRKERSFVNRLKSFMEKTPINRQKPDKYSVRVWSYRWQGVYREEILSNEELVELSAREVRNKVIRRLEVFMDSDDREYRRIDDFFQCLAFRSDALASTREDSPSG